jgi:hypothetical protein
LTDRERKHTGRALLNEACKIRMLNPWNPIDPVDFASIELFNKRGDRWKVFDSFIYWN